MVRGIGGRGIGYRGHGTGTIKGTLEHFSKKLSFRVPPFQSLPLKVHIWYDI